MAEQVGHRLSVVGSSDRFSQNHRDVDHLHEGVEQTHKKHAMLPWCYDTAIFHCRSIVMETKEKRKHDTDGRRLKRELRGEVKKSIFHNSIQHRQRSLPKPFEKSL